MLDKSQKAADESRRMGSHIVIGKEVMPSAAGLIS